MNLKEQAVNVCNSEKELINKHNKEIQQILDAKMEELESAANVNDENEEFIHNLQLQLDNLKASNNSLTEKLSSQQNKNAEMQAREDECVELESKLEKLQGDFDLKSQELATSNGRIAQLEGELNTWKMNAEEFHSNIRANGDPVQMPDGELPDVKLSAVSIRQPALNGTTSGFLLISVHLF